MGAAERSLRKYCDAKSAGLNPKYIFEPSVGLQFDSEDEAVEFYNLHSWEVGFGTRMGNWDRNKSGYQITREVVCQRQVISQNMFSLSFKMYKLYKKFGI